MPYINREKQHARPSFSGKPRPGGTRGRNRPRPQQGGRGASRGRQSVIHPSKYINKAVLLIDEEPYEPTHSFADFPFGPDLAHNIREKGYTTPSPIQDQAIIPILNGHDVIGLANTGTGKTAAFLLPIIEHLRGISVRPSVLIVSPTRELAQQIEAEFRSFTKGMGLYSTLLVGGMNIDRQIRDLRRRPHVVIGTPGRMIDLLERRELDCRNMTTLVLDEADRMLDMGFLPNIRRIVGEMPRERQTLFFSATITPEIHALTTQFLDNPTTVSVRTTETSDHVEQDVVEFHSTDHKYELLLEMLQKEAYDKVLVFCGKKFGAQRLADKLNTTNISAAAIHGNKSQSQRTRALDAFKSGRVNVLVATDVAARGLDIPNVSHVVNYDTPQVFEDYIHRIGRTGRAGARGHAHTFVPKSRQ
ncbi:DEAD/DEAH box helicase [Candidatus Saccharibacteria bacterium]|nr:DEAD/DEAH box helicase [Candidatus Saccharibacteria bacterium]